MKDGRAIIIGAGPAGLTAAIELQRHTGIRPIVIEASQEIGGLSRTVRYKGNRMDIGGHRFFSKSDRVMQWWLEMMPVGACDAEDASSNSNQDAVLRYQGRQRPLPIAEKAVDAHSEDLVMLVRQRKSRIYFLRRFFDYPIRLSTDTLRKMGLLRTLRYGLSYMRAALLPQRQERSLEDFLINRFGRQLYRTFFKSYTEKVWGVPCSEISAAWGAQRIKGLSLAAMARHFLKETFGLRQNGDLAQKQTETSLIEKFLYPKFGPGQLWEHAADLIRQGGGEIHLGIAINCMYTFGDRVTAVEGRNQAGDIVRFAGNYFFSTMPVRDLIRALGSAAPKEVIEVGEGLVYRDFITVGLLATRLAITEPDGSLLKDNWIYIQEPEVKVGRLQIFNNWSPWLVHQPLDGPQKVWIGLEYFCYETDPLWQLSDREMIHLAIEELARIGILKAEDVEDAHVVRAPKTYPAYFGSYDRFETIRNFTDKFENLFLVGRNGMHKYNNQDHSMLTAMTAVENIVNGVTGKQNLWSINTESEYHEEGP
jgi:protoporphyrinogen oxidase